MGAKAIEAAYGASMPGSVSDAVSTMTADAGSIVAIAGETAAALTTPLRRRRPISLTLLWRTVILLTAL